MTVFQYPTHSKLKWYRMIGSDGKELPAGYYWCRPQVGRVIGPSGPYDTYEQANESFEKGEMKNE